MIVNGCNQELNYQMEYRVGKERISHTLQWR